MVKIRIQSSFPKSTWVNAVRLETLNALRKVGRGVRRDFELTSSTWKIKPKFEMSISLAGGNPSITVGTDNEVYRYVSGGTKPHVIVPRNARSLRFSDSYAPKTSPGIISSSGGGSKGDIVFAKKVNHPGIKARNFDMVIAKKWSPIFVKEIRDAISRGLAK